MADLVRENPGPGTLSPSVRAYVRDAISTNTRMAYQSDLRHFLGWGGTLPASDAMLADYLAEHAGLLSVATLVRRLASISRAHQARALPNPSGSELVRATLRGIKRAHGRPQRRAKPLVKEDLFAVLAAIGGTLKDARDRALLLNGFAGGFRRSELIGIDRSDIETVRQGVVVHIRRSKTDQEGVGRKVGIPHGRFCGAGGTTCGLIDAGGYVIAGIDNDERCRETFVNNNYNDCGDYSGVRFLKYDIFSKTPDYPKVQQTKLFSELEDLITYYRERYPSVPLLFAIFAPCQPFTAVSKKTLSDGKIEQRSRDKNLMAEALKFVRRFEPEYVLSENVAGIQTSRYGGVWQRFRTGLDNLNYLTGSKVVCTSNFGIPQVRKRSILLASRHGLEHPPLAESELLAELSVPEKDPNSVPKTVKFAIGHLPPIGAGETHPTIKNHKTRSLSELNIRRISMVCLLKIPSAAEYLAFGRIGVRSGHA